MYLLNEGGLTVKYIIQTDAGENILQNRREYYSTLLHSEKCGRNALDMPPILSDHAESRHFLLRQIP
ncbi:Uncharacterised protein [Yersinia frederiksenii]|jgi:hypothetical protein|uniref:Uncharacterized protein n=1 Tax=Yersinia frederiksenii TaxID=29484 RepID=A0AAI8ZTM0_YERFR|nr:Uncharacterised protein [Yersinia frederiksenii]CFR27764.1 Uncharacterised protein [Yersinia frederiksenii]CNG49642.1 Uncharacterised protein [Yersinia frederiksenii]CQH52578.1 Uncharacterised protein [Yersinia frederiksenii]CQJ03522.1 Uncharacterised protein [Yersinia frederiksenii]